MTVSLAVRIVHIMLRHLEFIHFRLTQRWWLAFIFSSRFFIVEHILLSSLLQCVTSSSLFFSFFIVIFFDFLLMIVKQSNGREHHIDNWNQTRAIIFSNRQTLELSNKFHVCHSLIFESFIQKITKQEDLLFKQSMLIINFLSLAINMMVKASVAHEFRGKQVEHFFAEKNNERLLVKNKNKTKISMGFVFILFSSR
jgi:hypothetical protein